MTNILRKRIISRISSLLMYLSAVVLFTVFCIGCNQNDPTANPVNDDEQNIENQSIMNNNQVIDEDKISPELAIKIAEEKLGKGWLAKSEATYCGCGSSGRYLDGRVVSNAASAGNCNMRSGPSTQCSVKAVLCSGQTATYYSYTRSNTDNYTWSYVKKVTNGVAYYGWVRDDLLRFSGACCRYDCQ